MDAYAQLQSFNLFAALDHQAGAVDCIDDGRKAGQGAVAEFLDIQASILFDQGLL